MLRGQNSAAPSQNNSTESSKEIRLRDLKRLFDSGLIDVNVYNERQKSILQN
jgi:hypothetical protein